jgi:hypothetical protein
MCFGLAIISSLFHIFAEKLLANTPAQQLHQRTSAHNTFIINGGPSN